MDINVVFGGAEYVIQVLVYIAVVLLFFRQKTNAHRLKLVVLIAIIMYIIHFMEVPDAIIPGLYKDTLIVALVLLFGIPLWIRKETALVLVLLLAVLPLRQFFWLFLIGKAFYAITLGGIIYAGIIGVGEEKPSEQKAEKPKQ